jgi:hypothetical protein
VDFEISHEFDASAEEVVEALLDEAFQDSLHDLGSLEVREVLDQHERKDGTMMRRTRCVLDIEITGPARKFLGEQQPAWIEEAIYDPDTLTWTWKILPEVAGELLDAKGMIAVEDDGEATIRTVSGSVKVKVPLYGSKVESWIVGGIEAAYEDEADRLADWLEREN